jgi:hypothetical protein
VKARTIAIKEKFRRAPERRKGNVMTLSMGSARTQLPDTDQRRFVARHIVDVPADRESNKCGPGGTCISSDVAHAAVGCCEEARSLIDIAVHPISANGGVTQLVCGGEPCGVAHTPVIIDHNDTANGFVIVNGAA